MGSRIDSDLEVYGYVERPKAIGSTGEKGI